MLPSYPLYLSVSAQEIADGPAPIIRKLELSFEECLDIGIVLLTLSFLRSTVI